jgi:transcriptional regulator with XRE-family HTH domain
MVDSLDDTQLQEQAIGQAIRYARLQARLTQQYVLDELRRHGKTTALSTYQRWEKTGALAMVDALVLLDVLDVDASTFAEIVRRAASGELPEPDPAARGGDRVRVDLDEALELRDGSRAPREQPQGTARRGRRETRGSR